MVFQAVGEVTQPPHFLVEVRSWGCLLGGYLHP